MAGKGTGQDQMIYDGKWRMENVNKDSSVVQEQSSFTASSKFLQKT